MYTSYSYYLSLFLWCPYYILPLLEKSPAYIPCVSFPSAFLAPSSAASCSSDARRSGSLWVDGGQQHPMWLGGRALFSFLGGGGGQSCFLFGGVFVFFWGFGLGMAQKWGAPNSNRYIERNIGAKFCGLSLWATGGGLLKDWVGATKDGQKEIGFFSANQ